MAVGWRGRRPEVGGGLHGDGGEPIAAERSDLNSLSRLPIDRTTKWCDAENILDVVANKNKHGWHQPSSIHVNITSASGQRHSMVRT